VTRGLAERPQQQTPRTLSAVEEASRRDPGRRHRASSYRFDLASGGDLAGTPGPPRRRRPRAARVAQAAAAALVAVVGTEIGLGVAQRPAPERPSPGQILLGTMAAAERTAGFHYAGTWRTSGWSQTITGDALPSSGTQRVSEGGAQYSVSFADGVVYFDGNAAALQDELELPRSTAERYAGTWISLQPSDGPYASLAQSVTSVTTLSQVLIDPSRATDGRSADGHPVQRLSGRIPLGSARLDVTPGSNLPATYSARGSDGGRPWQSELSFSRWNQPLVASVPTRSRPFASLPGAAANGGPGQPPTA
jgi:hypothetical protein